MSLAPRRKLLWSSLTAGLLLGSCVTINIYFPAAAVEKAADRIIEETWGAGAGEGEKPESEGGPQSSLHPDVAPRRLGFGVRAAVAQEVDINVSTPAIRALKGAMQQRSGTLKPYLAQGVVGISSAGLLVLRDPGAVSMKEKAALTRRVEAENKDRESLYREIAKANKFDMGRVADIKSIFAASWIRNAEIGWWVQNAKGAWVQKSAPPR